ncbi:MAG: hypothetical protein QM570_13755 [Planctomycetota bacterium]|nr:hypothetical protein [Planctomycetota bacterium]
MPIVQRVKNRCPCDVTAPGNTAVRGHSNGTAKLKATRHLNWRLGLVLVLAIAILAVVACILQHWECSTRPSSPRPAMQSSVR